MYCIVLYEFVYLKIKSLNYQYNEKIKSYNCRPELNSDDRCL
jgi:hypothetical protein